jgi:hypothetical protein
MGRRVGSVLAGLATAVAVATMATMAAAAAPVDVPEAPSEAAPTDKDVFDVLRDIFNKEAPSISYDYRDLMLAAAPIISYSPTGGVGFGVAGNISFYRGPPETTRISSLVASGVATSKSQVLVNAKLDASLAGNRWNVVGDNRLYWTSQTTYGLGSSTTDDQAFGMKFEYFRAHETLYRQVRGPLYVGAGLLFGRHQEIRPEDADAADGSDSEYLRYSLARGFDVDAQTSAGGSLHLLYNSRDSSINPSRGVYASAGCQMFFEHFLGGDSTWQQLNYDLRSYLRLSSEARHRLAFWVFGNHVIGGEAPYLDLPATGWDTYSRTGRGYGQGRFRGTQMVYGEVEYRWTVTRNRLLGVVAFLNTETLSGTEAGEPLFNSFSHGGGVGLRLLINKESKTNLAVDFGWGERGEQALYLNVQEAF